MRAALREDALSATPEGFELRIGLPWIRSVPLSGVSVLRVELDERPLENSQVQIILGSRRVSPGMLVDEADIWWHLQDRLVITGPTNLTPGRHHVSVEFSLLVPYLQSGPNAPLILPLHLEGDLEVDREVSPSVARDVM